MNEEVQYNKREWKPFKTGGFYTCKDCATYKEMKEERDELSDAYMKLVGEIEEYKGSIRAFDFAMGELENEKSDWVSVAHYLAGMVCGMKNEAGLNPHDFLADAYKRVTGGDLHDGV
jgi:hypothetical protein